MLSAWAWQVTGGVGPIVSRTRCRLRAVGRCRPQRCRAGSGRPRADYGHGWSAFHAGWESGTGCRSSTGTHTRGCGVTAAGMWMRHRVPPVPKPRVYGNRCGRRRRPPQRLPAPHPNGV